MAESLIFGKHSFIYDIPSTAEIKGKDSVARLLRGSTTLSLELYFPNTIDGAEKL